MSWSVWNADFQPDILFTGSKQDEFVCSISPAYFEKTYGQMLDKIGHGMMHLFDTGGHPDMLTNPNEFYKIAWIFLTPAGSENTECEVTG